MTRKSAPLGPSRDFPPAPYGYGRHPTEKASLSPLVREADEWPLQIIEAGFSRWRKGDFWCRERAIDTTIEYVTAGKILLEEDGSRQVVHEGQAYILRKGSRHCYRALGPQIARKWYVIIRGFLLEPFMEISSLKKINVVTPLKPVEFRNALQSALHTLETHPRGFSDNLSTLAYTILRMFSASIEQSYPPLVYAAVQFIRGNLNRSLTDEMIAGHIRISTCHLRNVFKKAVGVTPLQYHTRERMAFARSLLRQLHSSVKEVAAHVGFDDPLYFSKVYRRIIGTPPSRRE
jgi:AraC family transcriptional regulator, arabinose operon regulatory protein